MKLRWKKDGEIADADGLDDSTTDVADFSEADAPEVDASEAPGRGSAYTPGKGRPTPSRRQAENRRRGPVAPPPTTRSEARSRRKELRSSMSKEDKRAGTADRKNRRLEQRERMMAGEEQYLMPRDKGPEKRFVRDVVDSRRNFSGLFMPFAIVLILIMFIPALSSYSTLVLLVFVICMAVDGVILGRLVNKRVRERFPKSSVGGIGLGWYAFTRSMQLRRMRAPKPQASPGDEV